MDFLPQPRFRARDLHTVYQFQYSENGIGACTVERPKATATAQHSKMSLQKWILQGSFVLLANLMTK